MIIVQPSVTLMHITPNAMELIEAAGRTCYKSEDKIHPGSAGLFCGSLLRRKHYSVLEHAHATFRIICDRGITHELVRHRIASYSQESTRYCNYAHDGEIAVIQPPGLDNAMYGEWKYAMTIAEQVYMTMTKNGVSPQLARSVLPTCLKTDIVTTMNFRQWRYVLKLRTSEAAHPQIREVMHTCWNILAAAYPVIFTAVDE